jgi:predicted CXXCH cytochrome family protein
MSRHSANVACRDCHSAHQPLRAALPHELVPPSLRSELSSNYDWQASNELCLKCHSPGALTTRLDRGFAVLNTVNYHQVHLERGQALCVECHEPHGAARPGLIRQRLLDGEVLSFMPGPFGSTCTTACHGVDHAGWSYRNAAR